MQKIIYIPFIVFGIVAWSPLALALAQPLKIKTIVGNGKDAYQGDGVSALDAQVMPISAVVSPDGFLLIADWKNHRLLSLGLDGKLKTIAGTGKEGFNGDGIPASQAQVGEPSAMAVSADGTIYFIDVSNHRIRKIDQNGIISTVAGTGVRGYNGDNRPAVKARLNEPLSLACAKDGTLLVSEKTRVRRIARDGTITTIAGSGMAGYSGNNSPALSARVNLPSQIAISDDGTIYFADLANWRIRKVMYENQTRKPQFGRIATIAGGGGIHERHDMVAIKASIAPIGLALRENRTIVFTDRTRIREIDQNGVVNTIAGKGVEGYRDPDDGLALNAEINGAMELTVAPNGDIIFPDFLNRRVRILYHEGNEPKTPSMLASERLHAMYRQPFQLLYREMMTKRLTTGEPFSRELFSSTLEKVQRDFPSQPWEKIIRLPIDISEDLAKQSPLYSWLELRKVLLGPSGEAIITATGDSKSMVQPKVQGNVQANVTLKTPAK